MDNPDEEKAYVALLSKKDVLFRINETFSAIAWSFSLHNSAQLVTRRICTTTRHSSATRVRTIFYNTTRRSSHRASRTDQGIQNKASYTTDQGIQIKACISKHEKYASPNTQMYRSRKTDQGMQLQTSPQQLGTVPSRIYTTDQGIQIKACICMHLQTLKCTDQGKRIKECNSKHRPNNSEQFPTRARSTQQLGTAPISPGQIKEYRSRHAFPNTTIMHLQTFKCTDQGKRIKECNSKHRPNNSNSSQRAQDLRNNSVQFPSRQNRSRNTDQGMHFQTLPPTLSRPHVANYVTFCELHSTIPLDLVSKESSVTSH
jgi:hypothetical protein